MQAYKLRGKIDATGNFKDFEDAIPTSAQKPGFCENIRCDSQIR